MAKSKLENKELNQVLISLVKHNFLRTDHVLHEKTIPAEDTAFHFNASSVERSAKIPNMNFGSRVFRPGNSIIALSRPKAPPQSTEADDAFRIDVCNGQLSCLHVVIIAYRLVE